MNMANTNHYVVATDDQKIEIHTRDIPRAQASEVVIGSALVNGVVCGEIFRQSEYMKLFRKMSEQEVEGVLLKHGLSGTQQQKWITESWKKVLGFHNDGVSESVRQTEKIVQMKVNKSFYEQFRDQLIPQLKSKGQGKSIYHYEGIQPGRFRSFDQYEAVPDSIKRNVGINVNDMEKFNGNIKSIKVLDPKSPAVKNGFFRYLTNNKLKIGMTALSVIIDGVRITLSVIEDGCQFGKSTTLTLVDMIASKAGAAIGAALGSIVPGIGSFVGGILGGIIFGFIGTAVGTLLCGLFPDVIEGPGVPKPDYDQFLYGDNDRFAMPLPDYNLQKKTRLPTTEYTASGGLQADCDSSSISRRATNDYQTSNVYGAATSDYQPPDIFGAPRSEYS